MAGYSVPQFQFLNSTGAPAAGGLILVYQTGTTTPVAIYSDGGLSTPASNPFTLDAYGRAEFYVGTTVNLRIDVYDVNTGFVETIDPVQPVTDAGGSANSIPLTSLAQLPAYTFLGNNTNATANVISLTAQQAGNNLRGFAGGSGNGLRNVQCAISQRGSSGTIASATPAYSVDGIIINSPGAGVSWQWNSVYGMPNGGPTLSNYLYIVGVSSNTDVQVYERVESIDAGRYASQTVTWQMTITNNTGATLTPTLTVKYPTVADNYTSSTTDAVVNAVNLQSLNNGGFGTLCYTFACNANAKFGIEPIVDFGAMNSNSKNISITGRNMVVTPGVAVGLNNSPPPLDIPTMATERNWNGRYYASTFPVGINPAQSAGVSGAIYIISNNASASTQVASWNFPVRMRVTPTATFYNPSSANANFRNITAVSDVSATQLQIAEWGVSVYAAGTPTAGQTLAIHITATAEL